MKAIENYDKVEANTGEYEVLPVGGYICKITAAEVTTAQKSGKEMLVINFDIAEGKYKDFYKKKYEDALNRNTDISKSVKWPGVYRQMLEGDKADSYFKGLITTLEASNPNFNWLSCNWDESKLRGLIFGGLFGREEYQRMDGSYGFSTKLRFVRTAEKIRNGEFEIPSDKLMKKTEDPFSNNGFTPIEDDDLPF